jgi:hypothetical protein
VVQFEKNDSHPGHAFQAGRKQSNTPSRFRGRGGSAEAKP